MISNYTLPAVFKYLSFLILVGQKRCNKYNRDNRNQLIQQPKLPYYQKLYFHSKLNQNNNIKVTGLAI